MRTVMLKEIYNITTYRMEYMEVGSLEGKEAK